MLRPMARMLLLTLLASFHVTLLDAFLAPSPVLPQSGPRLSSISLKRDRTTFTPAQAAPPQLRTRPRNLHTVESARATEEVVTGKDVSPSQAVSKSIFVEADLDACAEAAADLDNYIHWCRGGGMKKVEILKRYEDGRAENVRFTAGKLGIDMVNIMEYTYDDENKIVKFVAIEGDVMKTLDGCYSFEATEGGTVVTYELLLGFGSKLPDFAISAISGAIIRTALGALKKYLEER